LKEDSKDANKAFHDFMDDIIEKSKKKNKILIVNPLNPLDDDN